MSLHLDWRQPSPWCCAFPLKPFLVSGGMWTVELLNTCLKFYGQHINFIQTRRDSDMQGLVGH